MLTYLRNFFLGIILACGGLIPGVGLQTTAIIVGLYDELLNFFFQISEFFKTFGQYIMGKASKVDINTAFTSIDGKLGLPIILGTALTLLAFTQFIGGLFDRFPTQISAISFGIVLACILVPYKELSQRTWREFVLFLATFVAFLTLFSISPIEGTIEPSLLLFLVGGFLASFACLLPGISVSTVFSYLGIGAAMTSVFAIIIAGTPTLFAFLALLLFLIGFLVGITISIRLVTYLIKRYKSLFLAFLIGLMAASLRLLWPFVLTSTAEKILPWQESLPQFTQQLILITIAFVLVSIVRKFAENIGTLASSFGPKERTIIN